MWINCRKRYNIIKWKYKKSLKKNGWEFIDQIDQIEFWEKGSILIFFFFFFIECVFSSLNNLTRYIHSIWIDWSNSLISVCCCCRLVLNAIHVHFNLQKEEKIEEEAHLKSNNWKTTNICFESWLSQLGLQPRCLVWILIMVIFTNWKKRKSFTFLTVIFFLFNFLDLEIETLDANRIIHSNPKAKKNKKTKTATHLN